ncbi:hypothetical protein ACFRFH_12050 [Leifsonia sp. NPDC056824]|uniref:hypothetical protein n=1 Tax=Leifsonia sp. NPDC056824 TaxID=3345953 RepID=UPI0036A7A412
MPEAAKRVKRSARTIERWIESGDLEVVVWWSNVRYIHIDDLLRVYRSRFTAGTHRMSPQQIGARLAKKYRRG